jgi:hypothetical protein
VGFGVLTLPAGHAARLLDQVLPAEAHNARVAEDDDPDLATARASAASEPDSTALSPTAERASRARAAALIGAR